MHGKNGVEPGLTEAAAAPARTQSTGNGDPVARPTPLFSAKRWLDLGQRLLRGELLEKVSRETNVSVHRLSE